MDPIFFLCRILEQGVSHLVQVKENGPGNIFNVEVKRHVQFKNHNKIIYIRSGGQINAIWRKWKISKFVAKILCCKDDNMSVFSELSEH